MKLKANLIFFSLLFSPYLFADFCGAPVEKSKFKCNDEIYIYSKSVCSNETELEYFCNANAEDCLDDMSDATRRCFRRFKKHQKENKKSENCNWGWAGPKRVECQGKFYIYGTAACEDQIYKDVFCNEKYSRSGKACLNDNSTATISCYYKTIEPGKAPGTQSSGSQSRKSNRGTQ